MRIVVTGMGVVSPIGIGITQFWDAALNGRSGIRHIANFDSSGQRSQIAGEIPEFNPADHLSAKCIDQSDRFTQLALVAANQAIEDCGGLSEYVMQRVAVSIGSGMGGYATFESSAARKLNNQPLSPFGVPKTMANAASAWIAIAHKVKGPNLTFSTACSSAGHAIGAGLELLRANKIDAAIVGGAEACVLPLVMEGFSAMHALSTRFNLEPESASRPFDQRRDGFVMGEGAAVLVLEKEDKARQRGAKIYAELAGYGCSADASHLVVPDMAGQVLAMQAAMEDADVSYDSIGYINAHATSTHVGDIVETRAIKHLFGARQVQNISISATKSLIGHTIGASAAIGSIATVMAIHTSKIHPTMNLDNADPECDLDYTPNKARDLKIQAGMCNAFGFGGNNTSLIFTTMDER